MSLTITKVANHAATLESEQVEITITADTNLGDYELIDNSYHSDGSVSNVHPHPYRFPRQDVKKGDIVIVHTGEGTDTKKKLVNAVNTTYHYYRNSKQSFWNDTGDVAKIYRRSLVSEKAVPSKTLQHLKKFSERK